MEGSPDISGAADGERHEPQASGKSRSKLRRLFWPVLRILLLSYVGFGAVLYFFQSRLLYYPQRELEGTPARAGLDYEDVELRTSDGVKLSAWFVPAEPARGVVLFCHGNGGNISHRIDSIDLLNRLGLSVLAFDYRGYGLSEGKPSEEGTYLDAEAAWRYLIEQRGIDPKRIVVLGRSLGGAIAAKLARDHEPGALIVESSCTSVPDRASEMFPFLPIRLLCRFRYNTAEYIRDVKCPVLVVHSVDDDLIPFKHGQRLYEAATPPKQFLQITGGHNDGFLLSAGVYTNGLSEFLDKHLPPKDQ